MDGETVVRRLATDALEFLTPEHRGANTKKLDHHKQRK